MYMQQAILYMPYSHFLLQGRGGRGREEGGGVPDDDFTCFSVSHHITCPNLWSIKEEEGFDYSEEVA